ncbi:hypothetical protein FBY04_102153 [Pseudomonas sp. SJZ080]|nr:hypothetical protein FBY04_102153 [Pseudomonas sp. SJZ080]
MIKCLFSHKWTIVGGLLHSIVDGSCRGEYKIVQCERCGKLKQRRFY